MDIDTADKVTKNDSDGWISEIDGELIESLFRRTPPSTLDTAKRIRLATSYGILAGHLQATVVT